MLQESRKAGQIARTKSWIEGALISLANDQDFSNITVTKICKKAGVGRQTFYRHFSGKEDVVRKSMRRTFDAYLEFLKAQSSEAQDIDFVNLQTLRFWKSNSDLFQLVKNPSIRFIIFSELDDLMDRLVDERLIYSDLDPFLRNFRHWGMKGVLLVWAESDMRQTPEEINAVLKSVNRLDSSRLVQDRQVALAERDLGTEPI